MLPNTLSDIEQISPEWIAGIYTRRSLDDGDDNESESVKNQRMLIEDFLKNHPNISIYEYYCDDGYTGTNFDRPDFKRMIDDMNKGKINSVICKDLSRFGRDYIVVGEYLEKIFPSQGIKFVAINDGIDTIKKTNLEIAPFKAVMNDYYSRDISTKVKSAKKTKALRGMFTGGFAPYGYMKDPNSNSKLIIDHDVAWVVQKIFNMKIEGYSDRAIAKYLNGDIDIKTKISSPAEYKKQKGETWGNAYNKFEEQIWGTTTIRRILLNSCYIGNMVQNKSSKVGYKIKKKKANKEQEYITVEGTHEPIIDIEAWKKVQDILSRPNTKVIYNRLDNKYAGFLRCGDCGRAMVIRTAYSGSGKYTNRDKKLIYYVCSTYRNNGANLCTSKSIRIEEIDKILLDDIRKEVNLAFTIDEISEIVNKKEENLKIRKNTNIQLQKFETRLQQIYKLKKGIYEDYKLQDISREDYIKYKTDYEKEENELSGKIEELRKQRNEAETKIDNHNMWLLRFKKYGNIDEVTRDVIVDLVDKIEFFQADETIRVKITYKYVNEFINILSQVQECIDYPNESPNWLGDKQGQLINREHIYRYLYNMLVYLKRKNLVRIS